jgi:Polysaccharide deacetylase
MTRIFHRKILFLILLAMGVAYFAYLDYERNADSIPMGVALVVPDDESFNGHYVQMWMDAAQEDGIKLQPVHSSQWIRSVTRHGHSWEGAILPDTFHRKMMPGLAIALQHYVASGGKLMVVYDAGTLDQNGMYPLGQVELVPLVGFDYAMYHALRAGMTKAGAIVGGGKFFEKIGLPPGRYISRPISPQSGVRLIDEDSNVASVQVVGYGESLQRFASLVTNGAPNGDVLLRNDNGSILASKHHVGKGATLFVNIPLTYLKQRSDSVFLHGFLRYFVQKELQQPQLSEAPGGRGAIVLNWHVDAKPALPAMKRLIDLGLFEREGPFSIHVTAGPDVNVQGDKGGLDIDNSPEMQALLKKLQNQGHALGSHGGWIHNYFGEYANESNAAEMVPLLQQNHDAMTRLAGAAPREYSAPFGNQPAWANQWLQDHGVIASYLTGNIGLGPTRLWMGTTRTSNLWTFPVLTLGTVATAEDAFFQGVPQTTFDNWLQEVARYVQDARTVRLIYFHPPGAVLYADAVTHFIDRIGACRRTAQCSWLTMTQAAEFMNQREQTQWALQRTNSGWQLKAQHATNLKDLAWRIPSQRFAKPKLVQGDAEVEQIDGEWLVVARSGKVLQLDLKEVL